MKHEERRQIEEECRDLVTRRMTTAPRDVEAAATDYLQMTGLVAGGWMWLRMADAARTDSPADKRRRELAAFFCRWILPQTAVHATRIRTGSGVLDALPGSVLTTSY